MKEEDKVEDEPLVMENQRVYEFCQFYREDVRSLVQKSAKKTSMHPRPNANIYGHSLPRGDSSSNNLYTKFFFGIRSFFLSERSSCTSTP